MESKKKLKQMVGETYDLLKKHKSEHDDLRRAFLKVSLLANEVDRVIPVEKSTGIKFLSDSLLPNPENVVALGSVELGSDYVATCFSSAYMKQILKALDVMNMDSEGVTIAWAQNMPVMVGKLGKNGMMSGFVLAPRVRD